MATIARAREAVPAASRKRRLPRGIGRFLTLGLLAVLFLAPIYWMASTSFKPESDTIARPVQWIPEDPTLENYRDIFASPNGVSCAGPGTHSSPARRSA